MSLNSLDLRSAAGMLAVQSVPRIGPKTALRVALTEDLRPLEERATAAPADLEAAYRDAKEQMQRWEQDGLHVLALFDERYPETLRQLHEPPPLLWVRGDVALLSDARMGAVIGTREPSRFGITAAECFSDALADAGYGVVSGLAKGCDTIAHTRALEKGARTIAVMGGGLDRIYPAENKGLASDILASGGTLVAEQPLGARPIGAHLISRDRLQSGLAAGLMVAQTGVKGGSMHTVRFAAEQGRPVFCPEPGESGPKSDGLRALVSTPARRLPEVLPAWKQSVQLARRLGDRPVAAAVKREEVEQLVDDLERVLLMRDGDPDKFHRPTEDGQSAEAAAR